MTENMTPAKASATLDHCTALSFSLKKTAPMSTENSGFMKYARLASRILPIATVRI